jgi:hypothetical protein
LSLAHYAASILLALIDPKIIHSLPTSYSSINSWNSSRNFAFAKASALRPAAVTRMALFDYV